MNAVLPRRPLLLVLVPAVVALGLATLIVARASPGLSSAAASGEAQVAFLLAGWLVAAAGLAKLGDGRPAALLVAAGCAWFIAEFDSPAAEPAPLFAIGLVGAALAPAVLAHAGLRLSQPCAWRLFAIVVYVIAAGVLGVVSAALFDPAAEGCADCPRNLLLIAGDPQMHREFDRWGFRMATAAYAVTGALLVWSLIGTTVTRRRLLAPLVVPIAGYLVLAAAAYLHAWDRGFLPNDLTGRALWLGQAACLAGIAAGVAWERLRLRRTRTALARLVVDLASSPRSGGLRGLLAITLGDSDLDIVYPAEGLGWIDADGRSVPAPADGTTLTRDGVCVAVVRHRPGLLDDPRLADELQRAARLALDHERLHAELAAQLARLRESRARIAAASDAERRRLERDLHDGAQQGLLRLTLVAQGGARDEIRAALHELRSLAHGIFPALLHDQGLAAALVSLAEWDPRVTLGRLPDRRCPEEAEAAAYFCVATIARAGGPLEVSGAAEDGWLALGLHARELSSDVAAEVEDRVGALDGRVTLRRGDGVTVRIELPCG